MKCSGDAAIERGVVGESAGRAGDLRLCVDWCRYMLAVRHSCPIKDIFGILCLVEKEPIGAAMDLNPVEKADRAKVFHGKDGAQKLDSLMDEGRVVGSQYYIIDIE